MLARCRSTCSLVSTGPQLQREEVTRPPPPPRPAARPASASSLTKKWAAGVVSVASAAPGEQPSSSSVTRQAGRQSSNILRGHLVSHELRERIYGMPPR